MNRKDSLEFLDRCQEKVKNASNEDIEYWKSVYKRDFKSKKPKQITTTISAIIIILLIILLTPVIINKTTATTEATQEKVIRWHIENKKAPYKQYSTYEEYLADQNQSD